MAKFSLVCREDNFTSLTSNVSVVADAVNLGIVTSQYYREVASTVEERFIICAGGEEDGTDYGSDLRFETLVNFKDRQVFAIQFRVDMSVITASLFLQDWGLIAGTLGDLLVAERLMDEIPIFQSQDHKLLAPGDEWRGRGPHYGFSTVEWITAEEHRSLDVAWLSLHERTSHGVYYVATAPLGFQPKFD